MTAEDIIQRFNLKPHPKEGGFYSETYRSKEIIAQNNLPEKYDSSRTFSTCIYFLLTHDTFSEMHRISSDEIFHFYLGDPVKMLHLYPEGHAETIILGNDIEKDMTPQIIIPKGIWQGAMLIEGGKFALMGTTVSPGFEFQDYESGKREKLIEKYPLYNELIYKLTR